MNIDLHYLEEKIINIYEKCKKDENGRVLLRDIMQLNPNMKVLSNDDSEKAITLEELMDHAKTYFYEKARTPLQSSSSEYDPCYLKESESSYDCYISGDVLHSPMDIDKHNFVGLIKSLKDDVLEVERILYDFIEDFSTTFEIILKNIEQETVKFQNITEAYRRKMMNYQYMLEEQKEIMILNERDEQESADTLETLNIDKKYMLGKIGNLEIYNQTLDQQNKMFEQRLQFYEDKISQLEEDNTRLEQNNEYLQITVNKMELNIISLESNEENLQESLHYHKLQGQNLKEQLENYKKETVMISEEINKNNDLESLTFYCEHLLRVVLDNAPELLNKEFLYGPK